MFNVDGYRKKYREANIKSWFAKLLNFVTLNIIFFAALGVFFSILSMPIPTWEWLAVPVAFIFANFVEYALHRYPMHHKYKVLGFIYRQHTSQHHLLFTEENMMIGHVEDVTSMIAPWWSCLAFLVAVAPICALGLIVSVDFAVLIYITFVLYYWLYEVFHLLSHIWPWFSNKFAKHHTAHHNTRKMREYNFNVIFPLFDIIFKTKIK